MLFGKEGHDDLVIRSARVIDPTEGIDELLDVRIDRGVISQIGLNVDANGHRMVEGRGLVLAPGFVDPHVHLRTPGREDEETIASGTASAAAGGFCVILAMPNTEPVVDSAAVLGSLIETAREEAEVPRFLAAITKGQEGKELTEMAELADAGAAGFSDDGRPVIEPGMMRRALQYHAITGLRVAPHCEEPTLSRSGRDARGRGLGRALASPATHPSQKRDGEPRSDDHGIENQPIHLLHLSARESVNALASAQSEGVRASGEATPHRLVLTDEAVRSLDSNFKMNPPLRSPTTARRWSAQCGWHDHRHRDRPRTARTAREGRPVRGGAVRRHRARDRVRVPEQHLVGPGLPTRDAD